MFKKRKSADLGKPERNITIDLTCPTRFENGQMFSAIDKVEMCGLAIHIAKKILEGEWHITEQGYLLRGRKSGLPCKTIVVNVNGYNIPAIKILGKILAGKAKNNELATRVHFHFLNNVERIGVDEKGLYLIGMKQEYENQQAKRQILA